MLNLVSNRSSVLACCADCPADIRARQLALFLYETLPTIKTAMKKVFILLIILILTGCVEKSQESNENKKAYITENKERALIFIDRWNEIELSHTDDKYGEWGGDSDIIRIYSDGYKIYADYRRYLGSKEPPPPPKENEQSKKWYEYKTLQTKIDSIELNEKEKQLAENSIFELIKNRVRNESIQLGGIKNNIIAQDSSLIINDLNSIKWNSFQMLKNELMKK